jgi:hypothetical protein
MHPNEVNLTKLMDEEIVAFVPASATDRKDIKAYIEALDAQRSRQEREGK